MTKRPDAKAVVSADCRIAMVAIAIAVIRRHEVRMSGRREWLQHLVRQCEAKATRIAEQATRGSHSNGDATFIEVYAKTLPALVAAALDAHEQAISRAD